MTGGKWPWSIVVWLEPKRASERASEHDLTIAALKQAVEMWKIKKGDKPYLCGETAYAQWLDWLRGVDRGEVKDPKAGMLGNGWYYNVLEHSRAIAGGWLKKRAESFKGEARQRLLAAADHYTQITGVCMEGLSDPWQLAPPPNKFEQWTSEMRRTQIQRLEAAREHDRAAIGEIEKALIAGGVKADELAAPERARSAAVKTTGTKVYVDGVAPMDWSRGEMCEFASALVRTLSCVGEDVPYHYVMGVTGAAFRFTFGPKHWNPGFYGFEGVGPDVDDLIRRAFASVGYRYTQYAQGDMAEDAQRITGSIDRGTTVILRGHLVDASDWVLVGGYDRADQNVLFASSPYGSRNKPLPGYDAAPQWHDKTKQYILLGAKGGGAAPQAVYADALRLAVQLVRTPKVRDRYTGLRAMEALASVLRTERFPADAERNEDKPGFRYLCLLCYNMMLDDHKSAPPFLRDAAKALPQGSGELIEAAACYERAGRLRDQLEGILKSDFSAEAQKSILDAKVREAFAATLLQIRDTEEEGISHIERALQSCGLEAGFQGPATQKTPRNPGT